MYPGRPAIYYVVRAAKVNDTAAQSLRRPAMEVVRVFGFHPLRKIR
jgi:hypothetical protein